MRNRKKKLHLQWNKKIIHRPNPWYMKTEKGCRSRQQQSPGSWSLSVGEGRYEDLRLPISKAEGWRYKMIESKRWLHRREWLEACIRNRLTPRCPPWHQAKAEDLHSGKLNSWYLPSGALARGWLEWSLTRKTEGFSDSLQSEQRPAAPALPCSGYSGS